MGMVLLSVKVVRILLVIISRLYIDDNFSAEFHNGDREELKKEP
ncbi:MAG: hypothetical protein QXX41_06280 [Nitrososphaerota archaeon]